MESLEFTEWDNARTYAQGWCVSYSDEYGLEIQKVDELNVFKSDYHALAHVASCAANGDHLCRKALEYVRMGNLADTLHL